VAIVRAAYGAPALKGNRREAYSFLRWRRHSRNLLATNRWRLQQLFREEYGQSDLVLAEVFDLFAGTSTGAIIATFLAWGAPVEQVQQLYSQRGKDIFVRQRWWQRLKSKYRAENIAQIFKTYFCEDDQTPASLGSAKLKKLLLVVMRNATTGSPWPVSSNPLARFNAAGLDDRNLDIPIWQLLRASTAAPGFFPPEVIRLGQHRFLFVDGGVTPYNNPALLAVLMATLPCYRINWPAGRERLHLISIGTGAQRTHLPPKLVKRIYLWDQLKFVIPALIGSVAVNQDMLCRILGDCLHGAQIDSEIGELDNLSLLSRAEQKFSYVRYNCLMDSSEVGVPLTDRDLKLDNLTMTSRMQAIGQRYAEQQVRREHLFSRAAPDQPP
jgi:hypothetical protein